MSSSLPSSSSPHSDLKPNSSAYEIRLQPVENTATREEWVTARKALLLKEKALTKAADELAAQRRQLPHVKIDKTYTFEGPNGKVNFTDLFEGRKQLIIYHFMFPPPSTTGCVGCSFFTDNIPSHLQHLHSRNTTLVLVSRAPYSAIAPFKKRMGWTVPWYSSFGSDFNYDFHATNDEAVTPMMANWESAEALRERGKGGHVEGEQSGVSVFIEGRGGEVYHTYSAFARGIDVFLATNHFLDATPLGRQDGEGDKAFTWAYHDEYENN
ncbi:hypothetical protein VE03_08594 [Pseudogymnoascus sp. 23342-1-I1]|nr:hypothetical protein VE03_08594 [Pseudogymnoascus sp. 23342-1-I1]